MIRKVLVVGGAGYIGSHMVKLLLAKGLEVVTLDDFSTGYRDAILGGEVVEGSLADSALLTRLFESNQCDAVFHFASSIQVGESVANPTKYFQNNVVNTLNLLNAMVSAKVKYFIFSSTAAVYGEPLYSPLSESHPLSPVNPYGRSKAFIEGVLQDYSKAYNLRSVTLRYFNACGADSKAELGERHNPETHLIPLAIQAALGKIEALTVFGNDYNTKDGTCVRDYIHVSDLCDAHLLALDYLKSGGEQIVFNLGNESGFSVDQILKAVSLVVGKNVPYKLGPRRVGDPAFLVADSRLAKEVLGWNPRYPDIETIIKHAFAWEISPKRTQR